MRPVGSVADVRSVTSKEMGAGPKDFSAPEAVIPLDRVYIPATQPRVRVKEVRLRGPGLDRAVIVDDRFIGL